MKWMSQELLVKQTYKFQVFFIWDW